MSRCWIAAGVIAACIAGCRSGPEYIYPDNCLPGQPAVPSPNTNPVFLPIADPQCAWETIIDVVHAYFPVEREEPIRLVGGTLLEGSVITAPQISPTIFEPWRRDTADGQQLVENTMQTMRRRAVIRVVPGQGGYWVEVAVFKELEDVPQPERATASSAAFHYDITMTGIVNPVVGEPVAAGWIAHGRDASLEQYMIGDLLSRCGQTAPPKATLQPPTPAPAG
jgi:hypothetical protein